MTPRLVAVPLALVLATACEPLPQDPLVGELQGTWASCSSDGVVDRREELTFVRSRLEWTVATHPTADGTCGGEGVPERALSASYVLGDFVDARLGVAGAEVLARGLDVTDATRTFYTTVYIDTARTPRALHVGEASLADGRDMTSGAKRPIVLPESPLLLEP